MTNAERLREFHLALDGGLVERPARPSAETLALRLTLIREEYEEAQAAFAALAAAEAAETPAALAALMHELADLLYVTYGAFAVCGVDADAVFAEVHRANMQKLSGPRRADGKLLKPPDFRPADVAAVIARQMGAVSTDGTQGATGPAIAAGGP